MTYVTTDTNVTSMEKTQVYLRKEVLAALRKVATRCGRSVADLVREAVRKVVLKPQATGPVAIWDGEPKRASIDHDSVYDAPCLRLSPPQIRTPMEKLVQKARSFLDGTFRGVASPADTFVSNAYVYPHASEQAAMRSDWVRVGNHIRGAMKEMDKNQRGSLSN